MESPSPLTQERAVLREIFHLFFGAHRESVADAADRARKLYTLLTDPDLKSRAGQYVAMLEARAAQPTQADEHSSATGA